MEGGGLINKIHHGDCLDIMPLIQDKSVDVIFCDLPYGTTKFKWDVVIPFEPLFNHYERIIKENGIILLTAQQPFATDLINAFRKYFRYEIIWQKPQKLGFLSANKAPLRAHENILVFYKKQPYYNPQKSFDKNAILGRVRSREKGRYEGYSEYTAGVDYIDTGFKYPTSVINISNWNGALFGVNTKINDHGTKKPVDLIRYLILTYAKPGFLVLDNCMGSGTTAEACILEGIDFIGIEKDENFYKNSVKRIENVKQRVQSQLFQPYQLSQTQLF